MIKMIEFCIKNISTKFVALTGLQDNYRPAFVYKLDDIRGSISLISVTI